VDLNRIFIFSQDHAEKRFKILILGQDTLVFFLGQLSTPGAFGLPDIVIMITIITMQIGRPFAFGPTVPILRRLMAIVVPGAWPTVIDFGKVFHFLKFLGRNLILFVISAVNLDDFYQFPHKFINILTV
jgi:hypothetical protein